MLKFIHREDVLKSIMNQTKVPFDEGGIGMETTYKDLGLWYVDKNGISYDYVISWRICYNYGKKSHPEKYVLW